MTRKQVKKLLQSGEFTIVYHDNGECTLHSGRHKYEDCNDDNEVQAFGHGDQTVGYCPRLVEYLVDALHGKVDSI